MIKGLTVKTRDPKAPRQEYVVPIGCHIADREGVLYKILYINSTHAILMRTNKNGENLDIAFGDIITPTHKYIYDNFYRS